MLKTKFCKLCGKTKSIKLFSKNKNTLDRLSYSCKECNNKLAKRIQRKLETKIKRKAYNLKNRIRINKVAKVWRKKNYDKCEKFRKKWYKNNIEKIKAYQAKYFQARVKTRFEIDICGDCAYYPDCKIRKENAYACKYSLTLTELKKRMSEWFEINKRKSNL